MSKNKPKKTRFYDKIVIFFKFLIRSRMIKVILFIIFLNIILGAFYSILDGVPFHLGLYWATDTLTNTGTGLVPPKNPLLWYITTFLMWIGLGITLMFVEYVYVKMWKKNVGKKMVNYENHIVLIGWSQKMRHFLENLPGGLGVHHNYVLIANIQERPLDLPDIVVLIRGNPEHEDILINAGVKKAERALIVLEDDSAAVLIAMTIQSFNKEINICVNLRHRENIKHLQRIDVKEIVCDEVLTGDALIKAFYTMKK